MPETEILKERSELDPNYQWDLRPMYADDAAWEADLAVAGGADRRDGGLCRYAARRREHRRVF